MSHALPLTAANADLKNTEKNKLDSRLTKLIDALAREASSRDYASLSLNTDGSETEQ
jgi:hypothetical protein